MSFAKAVYGNVQFWYLPHWREQGLMHGFCDAGLNVGIDKELTKRFFGERSKELLLLKQVHGSRIVEFEESCADIQDAEQLKADGWLGRESFLAEHGLSLGVKSADCIPVLIRAVPEKGQSALVAALHCGWRSATAGLLTECFNMLRLAGIAPEELEIALGPGAECCCYEVKKDVLGAAEEALERIAMKSKREEIVRMDDKGSHYLSIKSLLKLQSEAFGVSERQIFSLDICTICSTNFFSARREKRLLGRQLSFIC